MTRAKNERSEAADLSEQRVLGHRAWHLGLTDHEVLITEFEWSVIRFQQAFERYILQIAHIAGLGELSYAELVLLHVIGFADAPITVGLLARQLNADNVTNIQYSLRKLLGYQLIRKVRSGKSNDLCPAHQRQSPRRTPDFPACRAPARDSGIVGWMMN